MDEQYDAPSYFNGLADAITFRFSANAGALLDPAAYVREMGPFSGEHTRDQLPMLCQTIGTNTVDIFGQDQAYAWFNHLNYRPRPVFQSYSAYNATLMQINERFYASSAAPEYVLFDFTPIDKRFPPLEDAWALRTLLADYTLVAADLSFLPFLKNRPILDPQK